MADGPPRRRTALALLVALAPVVFVWQLELAVRTHEVADTTLHAYVWPISSLPVYHSLMYVLFITNWAAATVLLRTRPRPATD